MTTDNTDATDVLVHDNGTLVGFAPISSAARSWFDDNVESESWQWIGNTLWIDHRLAPALLDGITNAGLEVA